MNLRQLGLLILLVASSTLVPAYAQFHYVQWGGTLHGTGDDIVEGMARDSSGHVYVVGQTFSPSMNYDVFGLGASPYSGDAANGKAFLGVFDGVTRSSAMHAIMNSSALQRADSVALDANGNVYVAGRFGGTADFGFGAVAASGPSDLFFAKFDSTATLVMLKIFQGSSVEYWSNQAIALDSSGNIFLVGQFGAAGDAGATFDGGAGPLLSPAGSSAFALRLDSGGNLIVATVLGRVCDSADAAAEGVRLALDGSGNVIVVSEAGTGSCA